MNAKKVIAEKYEIHRELKRGRFSVIYYGTDLLHGKPLAIKVIDPG